VSSNVTTEFYIATRETLVQRLKGVDDHRSWQEFFDTYWRLIYGAAIKAGLREDEARDVVQETVVAAVRNIPESQYDPAKCAFKTWLLNLTRSRIVDQIRKRQAAGAALPTGPGIATDPAGSHGVVDPGSLKLEAIVEEEWKFHLLNAATERVKRKVSPKQYQMFYLHVLKDVSVQEVARRVGTSVGRVYLAKRRISRLLKKEVRNLEASCQ